MACTWIQRSLFLFPRSSSPSVRAAAKNGSITLRHGDGAGPARLRLTAASAGDLRPDMAENPEGIISGEWAENISLLSYDDLKAHLETQIVTDDKMKLSALLGEVMSTPVRAAKPQQRLEEIEHNFHEVSGLPVVDDELRCVGVISKKDMVKASDGLKSKVGEVMSSPAITLSPDKAVLDAAALMLKKKIHRIPILNERGQVVGIVTRSDVFQALETAQISCTADAYRGSLYQSNAS